MAAYAVAVFLGAFLVFQIQPLVAKVLLPWFGGSAAVWTTCLMYFQTMLVAGYLYAYLLTRYSPPRIQGQVHAVLLLCSLLLLPVTPAAHWKPQGAEEPVARILLLLSATVGAPYLLLAATGPLYQSWFTQTRGTPPYWLFAVSNAGSLLALISYPVVFEPFFSRPEQSLAWSCAYVAFVLLAAGIAWSLRKTGVPEMERDSHPLPAWGLRLFWVVLAACPSALLASLTNHLTQNVAPVPFLWILLLSVYLLSFILCFESNRFYWRGFYFLLLIPSLGYLAYWIYLTHGDAQAKWLIAASSLAFFACCMVCHGELARARPHPSFLTAF